MSGAGRWADLAPRIGSAVVMVVIAAGAVWAGSTVFHVFVSLICAAMVWELVRMLDAPGRRLALPLAALAALALMFAIHVSGGLRIAALAVPVLIGGVAIGRHRAVCAAYMALVMLAGHEMMMVRDVFGLVWIVWLIVIVIVSDVAGYFAGRMLGGPKFWPRVSPKKTWSGTIAGWIGAALVGAAFAAWLDVGALLIPYSICCAFAAQMGDIAESAVKRLAGVKDSSALIPGHGGFLDRFDGMLGASFFVLIVAGVFGLPPGAV